MNIKGSVLLLKEGKVIDSDYILENIQGFSNPFYQFHIKQQCGGRILPALAGRNVLIRGPPPPLNGQSPSKCFLFLLKASLI